MAERDHRPPGLTPQTRVTLSRLEQHEMYIAAYERLVRVSKDKQMPVRERTARLYVLRQLVDRLAVGPFKPEVRGRRDTTAEARS